MIEQQKIVDWLTRHEVDVKYRKMGFQPVAYFDDRGYLTIGIGCNLDAAGAADRCAAAGLDYAALRAGQAITLEQAQALLSPAIREARDMAVITIAGFLDMPEPVQLVVIDMLFNMGREKFLKFHRFIDALEAHDWPRAITEMRASLWYSEVGTRATDDIDLVSSVL